MKSGMPILAAAFLAGCAHLETRVEILNRECLDPGKGNGAELDLREARIRESLWTADQVRVDLEAELGAFYRKLGERGVMTKEDVDLAVRNSGDYLRETFASLREAHLKFLGIKESFDRAEDEATRARLAVDARSALTAVDRLVLEIADDLQAEADAALADALEKLRLRPAVLAAEEGPARLEAGLLHETIASKTKDLGRQSVFDDPLAWSVITAPDECWKGVYDRTWGSGYFGNTDIAIKLESAENLFFTLKGIRVDARKVAVAMSKVLKQSIFLMAGGVQVPSGAAGPAPGSVPAMDALAGMDAGRVEHETRRRLSRVAAMGIVDAILGNWESLTVANPADRTPAVDRLKAAFDAYRPSLVAEPRAK